MGVSQRGTKRIIVVAAIVIVLLIGWFAFLSNGSESDNTTTDVNTNTSDQQTKNADDTSLTTPVPGANIDEMVVDGESSTTEAVVTYVNGRFDPESLGPIATGTVVKFFNEGSSNVQISSDDHPSHLDLPGFDSGILAPGEEYEFTFEQTGTWSFHNHLEPSETGEVTVSEL